MLIRNTKYIISPSSLHDWLSSNDSVTLTIRVRPNAPMSKLKGILTDGSIKLDIAAPPEDGKANEELIRFLSEECEVRKERIEVLSGQTGRVKVVRITR